MAARLGPEHIFGIAGKQVQNHDTVYRLAWMREHGPELLEHAAGWLLIEDWLSFRLCGSRATESTMASSTSLYDPARRDLVGGAGRRRRNPLRLLAPVKPCGTFLGEVHAEAARATGLAAGTPVFLGGHDYLCAALGEGVVEPGDVLDIIGTWELALSPTPAPALEAAVFQGGLTVEATAAPGAWSVTGFAVAGGTAEWYRRELTAFAGGLGGAGEARRLCARGRSRRDLPPAPRGRREPHNNPAPWARWSACRPPATVPAWRARSSRAWPTSPPSWSRPWRARPARGRPTWW